jgi:hypothetical protein
MRMFNANMEYVMYESGVFYIDGGFRLCIIKRGYKFTHVIYLDACKVKKKKLKGNRHSVRSKYPTTKLASKFLQPKTSWGADKYIPKGTKKLLRQAIAEFVGESPLERSERG